MKQLWSIRQEARSDVLQPELLEKFPLQWWHLAAYSCCGLDHFQIGAENIARQIGIPLSVAEGAVSDLLGLGWLKEVAPGQIQVEKGHKDLTSAWTPKSLLEYRKQIHAKSEKKIGDTASPEAFKISMFSISPDRISLVQKETETFMQYLREIADRGEHATEVYVAHFHCFKV